MFAAFRIIYSEADCEYPLDSFIEKRKIMGVLNIVLHEPEIPANTGNIGRTCVATGTRLHLIEPLGFRLNEKAIKRAGMDYWEHLDVTRYLDYEDFLKKNPGAKIYYATTKAPQTYTASSLPSYWSGFSRKLLCSKYFSSVYSQLEGCSQNFC